MAKAKNKNKEKSQKKKGAPSRKPKNISANSVVKTPDQSQSSKNKRDIEPQKNGTSVKTPEQSQTPVQGGKGGQKSDSQKNDSTRKGESLKNEKQEKRGGVPLSTSIAGMFLTLCLGLYLGSLMPDVLNTSQKPAPPPRETAVKGPSPAEIAKKPAPDIIPEDDKGLAISQGLKQHIEHLEKELAANPGNAKLLAELGNAFFDTGQTRKAIEAYEKSLAINPDNPDVLTDLGIMFREEHNFDKALECFRKATEINPGHLNALFNQGVVLGIDQHRHAEAKGIWEKVLQISPDARTPDGRKVTDLIKQMGTEQH